MPQRVKYGEAARQSGVAEGECLRAVSSPDSALMRRMRSRANAAQPRRRA